MYEECLCLHRCSQTQRCTYTTVTHWRNTWTLTGFPTQGVSPPRLAAAMLIGTLAAARSNAKLRTHRRTPRDSSDSSQTSTSRDQAAPNRSIHPSPRPTASTTNLRVASRLAEKRRTSSNCDQPSKNNLCTDYEKIFADSGPTVEAVRQPRTSWATMWPLDVIWNATMKKLVHVHADQRR